MYRNSGRSRPRKAAFTRRDDRPPNVMWLPNGRMVTDQRRVREMWEAQRSRALPAHPDLFPWTSLFARRLARIWHKLWWNQLWWTKTGWIVVSIVLILTAVVWR